MKCGICKSDLMNVYGSDRKTVLRQRVIRDASDLWDHKQHEHSEAIHASRMATERRRKQQEDHERIAEDRRRQLRLAASKPAIWPRERWSKNKEVEYVLTTTAEMHISAGNPERGFAARYPEPEIFETYQAVQAEIARLQEESNDILKRAWEAGLAITEADIDAVQVAGEAEAGEQLSQREG